MGGEARGGARVHGGVAGEAQGAWRGLAHLRPGMLLYAGGFGVDSSRKGKPAHHKQLSGCDSNGKGARHLWSALGKSQLWELSPAGAQPVGLVIGFFGAACQHFSISLTFRRGPACFFVTRKCSLERVRSPRFFLDVRGTRPSLLREAGLPGAL